MYLPPPQFFEDEYCTLQYATAGGGGVHGMEVNQKALPRNDHGTDDPVSSYSQKRLECDEKHLGACTVTASSREAKTNAPDNGNPQNFRTVFLVVLWLLLSCSLVLCNKYIIDNRQFSFPATLTFWHLSSASIVTQLLARCGTLLNGRHSAQLSTRDFVLVVTPIGILFAGSLVCNNMPYLSLSIAFIQMLKGLGPAFVLFACWTLGLETPSLLRCTNIGIVVLGVAVSTVGELKFAINGFLYQMTGLLLDGYRLGLTRKLLSGHRKMDPLVALYFMAPVSAMMLAVVAGKVEWWNGTGVTWEDFERVGWALFLLNATLAFALNLVIVQLIGETGPLTIPLCAELKNIFIVLASVVFWGTFVTPVQMLGYATASTGLVCYSVGGLLMEKLRSFTEHKTSDDIERSELNRIGEKRYHDEN